MKFLHSHEIILRDLKPENILFDDYLFQKIIDFGLSKRIMNEIELEKSGIVGTIAYCLQKSFRANNTTNLLMFMLLQWLCMK